jgi:hypothetical protein
MPERPSLPRPPPYSRQSEASLFVYSTIAFLGILVFSALMTMFTRDLGGALQYPIVCGFGALVGVTELVQRYREDPLAVLRTPSALLYIVINALASAFALFVVTHTPTPEAPLVADAVTQVVLAGIGGMAILRSALFRARVGDQDVAVGPAVIIDVLLAAADRDADRRMALMRIAFSIPTMRDIDFNMSFAGLKRISLGLMQNLTATERQLIEERLEDLKDDAELDDRDKAVLLALVLSTFVGRKVIEDVVAANRHRWDTQAAFVAKMLAQATPPPPPPPPPPAAGP